MRQATVKLRIWEKRDREETDEGDYMESKSEDFAERLAEMIGFL